MAGSGCILHVISVGFHHRRGATVETVFPQIKGFVSSGEDGFIELPAKWKHLASLALPDGAHNYLKDTVYFTLPSLEKDEHAVFGIASYRQAYSTNFSHPAPQPTRNTVQKSLVVLTRFPLFSLIAHHLSSMAESLFEDGQFSPERLKAVHTDLENYVNVVFSSPTTYQDALTFNLSASNFLRVYGRDALVCFKLLLLERRVLFDGESAGWMCNWILVLLSLFPDLIAHGLSHATLVDHSWIADRACWVWSQSLASDLSRPATVERRFDIGSPNRRTLDEATLSAYTASVLPPNDDVSTSTLHSKPASNEKFILNGKSLEADTASLDPSMLRALTSDTTVYPPSGLTNRRCSVSELDLESNVPDLEPHINQPDFTDPLPVPDTPFATDHWGFPLALFTKSNLVPLYVPLGYLDFLLEWERDTSESDGQIALGRGRCVRGFLAGATNPLLRTHKQLADVIVTSLSPNDGLPDPRVNQMSGELTSLFGQNLKPLGTNTGIIDGVDKQSMNVSKPPINQSRGFTLPKRTPQVVRVCSPDPSANEPRGLPAPLSQALQLSRMDRLFIDELIRTVLLWYQAKAHLLDSSVMSGDVDIGELLSNDDNANVVEQYLSGLTPSQRTVLMRFPSASILDTWIRQQFQSYLRALLLTADGYGDNMTDFNGTYIVCLQTTRCFLVWRGQFVPSKVFSVSSPKGLKASDEILSESGGVDRSSASEIARKEGTSKSGKTSVDLSTMNLNIVHPDLSTANSTPSTASSVVALLSQHPGRRYVESDDWEQLVDGFKRFGNLAADRGRRLVSQGMLGLNKLGKHHHHHPRRIRDINANWRSTVASNAAAGGSVISKFSDAFRSFLGSTGSGVGGGAGGGSTTSSHEAS